MKQRIFTHLVVAMLLAGSLARLSATDPTATAKAQEPPFATPLRWISSDVLVRPVSDETHEIVSVKDPTVVRYDGLWHIYATAYSTSAGTWSMVYLNFRDWADAPEAKLTYIDINPDLRGYHCAPHVFYFRPHKKWYLIFQSQQPQYCTTDDISRPETWTAPRDFFEEKPEGAPRLWIDYHVICDDTYAYLFFTGDNGRFYRCRTRIEDFPGGMSNPEIAIQDDRNSLFEGSSTYRIKGSGSYLTLIEALSPARYYRAWIADSLDGAWRTVKGADSWDTPFAGINNVTFEEGVEPWTRDISHGEAIRDGYDETMTIDLSKLQFLYQGRDPESGGNYSLLPYRLGLLIQDRSRVHSGDIHDTIDSEILGEKRALDIRMPRGYSEDSAIKYEVIYILDGEWNLENFSFIHNFAMEDFEVAPAILVSLPNTYIDGQNMRDRDFLPLKMKDNERAGGGDNFIAFLRQEAIPYIDAKYPTSGVNSLYGHSYGGLFSMYALLAAGDLFANYYCTDPPLGWENGYVKKLAEEVFAGTPDLKKKLWIAGTSQNSSIGNMSRFLDKNAPKGLIWKTATYPNEKHNSVRLKGIYDGVKFINGAD